MFFHVAGLYVTLHAEFLAAVQIIVYAGAILVLYLFVVMLLNVKQDDRYHHQWLIAALVCVPLLLEFVVLSAQSAVPINPDNPILRSGEHDGVAIGNIQAIGETLFSTYLFPFEVASLILLVAMIGAIILAKRDLSESRET
jgi:NADH-quinone oxidoreductase subunit J